jgi:hypothetical protein
MSNKAYIITFDSAGFNTTNYKVFHKRITDDPGILSWWHHLEQVYIIIVPRTTSSKNVSEFVRGIIPNRMFFVAEIKLSTREGNLPSKAWEWIEKWTKSTENNTLLF